MIDKKVAIIIQARMGSTRLPEKILMDIEGKPMLWHVIERVKRCETADLIVVATTDKEDDSAILQIARECGVGHFTGSEDDVLERCYLAATECGAEIIVRVTADCPLIDPCRIDEVVTLLVDNEYDYINPDRNFAGLPRGIRAEAFTLRALRESHERAQSPREREHVTPFMQEHHELFKHGWLEGKKLYQKFNHRNLRLTVDEEADLRFMREIYRELYSKDDVIELDSVFQLFEARPDLLDINKGVQTKNV